jgi:hypothetical protein
MTFRVASARRFECRKLRYCSIDGCMLFPFSPLVDAPCYSTTAIPILRDVNARDEEPRCCTFSGMFESFLIEPCRRRKHLRHVGLSSGESSALPPSCVVELVQLSRCRCERIGIFQFNLVSLYQRGEITSLIPKFTGEPLLTSEYEGELLPPICSHLLIMRHLLLVVMDKLIHVQPNVFSLNSWQEIVDVQTY